jgi:hypothetical protein
VWLSRSHDGRLLLPSPPTIDRFLKGFVALSCGSPMRAVVWLVGLVLAGLVPPARSNSGATHPGTRALEDQSDDDMGDIEVGSGSGEPVPSPPPPSPAVFANRTELLIARDAWCTNTAIARERYGNISEWDISAVDDLSMIFCACVTEWCLENRPECNGACSTFDEAIGGWNTSAVTTLADAFQGASAFNHPLDAWQTSRVTSLWGTFYDAASFNQPLESWDTTQVSTLRMAFRDASAFNQPLPW